MTTDLTRSLLYCKRNLFLLFDFLLVDRRCYFPPCRHLVPHREPTDFAIHMLLLKR